MKFDTILKIILGSTCGENFQGSLWSCGKKFWSPESELVVKSLCRFMCAREKFFFLNFMKSFAAIPAKVVFTRSGVGRLTV